MLYGVIPLTCTKTTYEWLLYVSNYKHGDDVNSLFLSVIGVTQSE